MRTVDSKARTGARRHILAQQAKQRADRLQTYGLRHDDVDEEVTAPRVSPWLRCTSVNGHEEGQRTTAPEADDNQCDSGAVGMDRDSRLTWEVYCQMTPLRRQEYREQRLAGRSVSTERRTGLHGNMRANYTGMHPMLMETEAPPKCKAILKSAGSAARVTWENVLQDYDHRIIQYRITRPWYVPPSLSKWVDTQVWRDVSEELLREEDQTDGGPLRRKRCCRSVSAQEEQIC